MRRKNTHLPLPPSCIDAVLRRLLCGATGVLRTVAAEPPRDPGPRGPAPGVVARLMGLADMPPPQAAAAAVRRPRPSSPSLRRFLETPAILTRESDEFLVLSFGRSAAERKAGPLDREDPQNSSPVSVLECAPAEFGDVETSSSSSHCREEDAEEIGDPRRRKLSSQLDMLEVSPPAPRPSPQMWREIGNLAAEEAKAVNWPLADWKKQDCSRSIEAWLGYGILDSLLVEAVADLCRVCSQQTTRA